MACRLARIRARAARMWPEASSIECTAISLMSLRSMLSIPSIGASHHEAADFAAEIRTYFHRFMAPRASEPVVPRWRATFFSPQDGARQCARHPAADRYGRLPDPQGAKTLRMHQQKGAKWVPPFRGRHC